MSETALDYPSLSDFALWRRASAGDARAVSFITTSNNQQLFRAAWSILKDRADAEDVVQEAYLQAFTSSTFDGRSSLATWLTRIVINQALTRKRAAARWKRNLARADVTLLDAYKADLARGAPSPEQQAARAEIAKLLEAAIARLPDAFRTVFVLREVEGMSVEETAIALSLAPQTVKTRLHRARGKLREALDPDLASALAETLQFAGADCARMTQRTLEALGLMEEGEKHE